MCSRDDGGRTQRTKGVWPNDLEPEAGPKRTLKHVRTEEEARAACRAYNTTHTPGRYSAKAEYE